MTHTGTCAFTRTGINAGDEILLVGVRPHEFGFSTYLLNGDIHNYYYDIEKWKPLHESEELKDKMIEQLGEDKFNAMYSPKHPIRFAKIGRYNEFDGIEGFDNLQDLPKGVNYLDWQFMIHLSVVKKLLCIDGDYPNLTTTIFDENFNMAKKVIDIEGDEFIKLVEKLVEIAYIARIQLANNHCIGKQFIEWDELFYKELIHEVLLDIIKEQEKYLYENEIEESELYETEEGA